MKKDDLLSAFVGLVVGILVASIPILVERIL